MSEVVVIPEIQAPNHVTLEYDVEVPFVTLVTQADWTEEDPNAKGYIWHKPVLSSVATSGSYNDLSNTPAIPSQTSDLLNDSGFITKEVSDLLNYTLTSDLATVATSGSYNDLFNLPNLATVATTGSYNDLLNTPSLPTSNDFIPQVPDTQVYQNKLAGSTITDASNRVLPALNYAAGNGYIGFGLGDSYRHLLFTEYNATLYAPSLDFKSEMNYTVNSKGPVSLSYADNYNRKIMLDLINTSSGAELLLRKDTTSTPILIFPTNDEATINLPKGLSILAQQTAGSTMNFVSNGKIQIVNTSTGGIEIIKSAQSIKLQDSGVLAITNGSGQTDIVGTGGVNINGTSNAINIAGGGGIAVSGPTFTFNTKTVATLNDIPSLTGYATETYVTNAVSTHNSSNLAHSDIRALIPAQATSTNQLADKAFVNSSIATETATFQGNYNVVSDLSLNYNASRSDIILALYNLSLTPDENDYLFVNVPTSNLTPAEIAYVDKYKYDGTTWSYEYTLNNSGYTAAQWASINSGVTSNLVTQIGTNASDISTLQGTVAGLGATAFSNDYNDLDNLPTIPTVYDGVTTLQLNGTQIDTFSANQSVNNTINIEAVPTFPTTSNLTTLVAGKLNTLGSVDYATIALPATPGTAEYNGTFTADSTLSGGDITQNSGLSSVTYWSGDTTIVPGKFYSFSIQNGVGFIVQMD